MVQPEQFDCYFQCHNQSQCHRIVLFHEDNKIRSTLFPPGSGTSAYEPGPRTDKTGPCLTIIKGATIPPVDLTTWIGNTHLAHTIGRVYYLRSDGPQLEDRQQLVEELLSGNLPPGPSRLQCYPKEMETWLVGELPPDSFPLHPVDFETIIYVVQSEGSIRYTALPANTFFRHSPDGPKRVPDQFCKAAGKAAEVLFMFQWMSRHGGVAMDLGAAPGGWTKILAQQGMDLVIAIDPAELHQEVLAMPNVVHIRKKAENSLEDVMAVMGGRQLAMLVCDINSHPMGILEAIGPMLPLVESGGVLVLTMKFRGVGRNKSWSVERMQEALDAEQYEHVQVLWLFSNTVNERTVIAVKK